MMDLTRIAEIAKQVFDEQTGEELQRMKEHFGNAYNEATIIAEIAVKMVARIAGLPAGTTRAITPVDTLADRGVKKLT